MSSYEYAVIPAPSRAEKTKGAKTGIDRFAATLTGAINEMARDGWEYIRAETLPAEERSGLTSRSTVYHNLLVFRRPLATSRPQVETHSAKPAAPPAEAAPEPRPEPKPQPEPQPQAQPQAQAQPAPAPEQAAEAPARGPFTAPMRPSPKPQEPRERARISDPPLTAPEAPTPAGPRLGPASR